MPHLDKKSQEILQRAYDLKNKEETKKLYADWAATYDQTMVDGLGYSAPETVADLLADHLDDKTSLIVDIGCGTGLTGKAVFENGFKNLVGLDFSQEMLNEAAKLDIYRQLLNQDLTTRLDIDDGQFDAAVSSGIFTYGHLDASCLDEIFRIIKKDGLFVCVVRLQVWKELGFKERFTELQAQGLISQIEQRDAGNYVTSDQPDGHYLVFMKN